MRKFCDKYDFKTAQSAIFDHRYILLHSGLCQCWLRYWLASTRMILCTYLGHIVAPVVQCEVKVLGGGPRVRRAARGRGLGRLARDPPPTGSLWLARSR